MKRSTRNQFLAVCVLVILAGGIAALVLTARENPNPKDEDFLEQVHHLQETAPSGPVAGALPPMGTDMDAMPDIWVETQDFHAGVIANDEAHQTALRVENRGKTPLKIVDISTTCACTQGFLPEKERTIPAGASVDMQVFIFPNRIPGFYSHKVLTINSNDPDEPALRIDVKCDIEPEFEVTPDQLEVGEVAKGSDWSGMVHLRQLEEEPLIISGASAAASEPEGEEEPPPSNLRLEVEEVPENEWRQPNKREYKVHVSLAPHAPAGPLRERFYIHTNVKRTPALPYAVVGDVVAPYTLNPQAGRPFLVRGVVGREDAAPRTIELEAGAPARIVEVQQDPAYLAADIQAGEHGPESRVALRVGPDAPKGQSEMELRLVIETGGKQYVERYPLRLMNLDPPNAGAGS